MSFFENEIRSLSWTKIVEDFFLAEEHHAFELSTKKIAIWSAQLEILEQENQALPFLRSMQNAMHSSCILQGLALYPSAIAQMRTMLESAMYYTYYRTHPEELKTLAKQEQSWFFSKKEILDYHDIHTENFKIRQSYLNLKTDLEAFYKKTSEIIHAQIPGQFLAHVHPREICYHQETLHQTRCIFFDGLEIIHKLFLCTIAPAHWNGFTHEARLFLLKGLNPDQKRAVQPPM